jgi:hypothetical protein
MRNSEFSLVGRNAYGEAARLSEMTRFDRCYRRHFAAGVGDQAEAIEQEVMRRVGPRIDAELVKLAVEDDLEGRRPRS